MSLHFILGGSGSGKSTWLFKKIQKDASGNPGINYLVLVPDQFTLETQKTLVSLNGNKGILNIDVLSFHRLAYRAFEEVPALRRTVLEDMGKIMILYQVFSKKKKEKRAAGTKEKTGSHSFAKHKADTLLLAQCLQAGNRRHKHQRSRIRQGSGEKN